MEPVSVTKSASGFLEFWHHQPGAECEMISVRTTRNDLHEVTVYWDSRGDFWRVDEEWLSDFVPRLELSTVEGVKLFVEAMWLEGRAKGY